MYLVLMKTRPKKFYNNALGTTTNENQAWETLQQSVPALMKSSPNKLYNNALTTTTNENQPTETWQ